MTSTSSPGPGCSHPRSGPHWQKESDSHEPALSEPAVTVGVLKETMPGEQRVAVVPESVPALARAGVRVLVEPERARRRRFPTAPTASRREGRRPGRGDRRGRRARLRRRAGAGADRPAAARPGAHRPAAAAGRARTGRPAGQGRGDRDQPGRAAPHGQPGPVHGRAHVPGQRGRLQGGAGRGRSFRPVLPHADHRGRDEPAGERPRARRGRGRPAGHGHRPPTGRRGDRLRHPAGDP